MHWQGFCKQQQKHTKNVQLKQIYLGYMCKQVLQNQTKR